ncbi:ribosome biogenesis GTP-binding protein YihA/YsxC [Aureitalea marina]|uniref:Probable GTP-binding protein EngB n=1 Tax=Aureitalea marina TaxID=930804 RepID=A0A2S7KM15_9FLAO|nr:ribosome biogenesis GTP-binding protein YihA/YsxC [Aureitalea marina]PQB03675.1 YihA family ribosome biogenesis GTP-binding protein [Aureitalea marina]
MKISSARFVMSNSDVAKCPDHRLPEYAFIGRSNVGKSSLINMLMERKSLAKTSGRPGKTQLINHFIVNEEWYLVDLPGYGYARVSKKAKKTFQKFITQYFEKRKQLVSAFVLIDCRHDPQPIDMEFMNWLGSNGIPFSMVFTKADKLKPQALQQQIDNYLEKMLEHWEEHPPYFVTSSSKRTGRDQLLEYIDSINREVSGR